MSNTNDETEKLLALRAEVYGDYSRGVKQRQEIMASIMHRYSEERHAPMPGDSQQHFIDIVNKIIRLSVTPEHVDSWRDVAGYAMLIVKSLESRE